MIPGIVYSWSRTIPLDELEMYQFFCYPISCPFVQRVVQDIGVISSLSTWLFESILQLEFGFRVYTLLVKLMLKHKSVQCTEKNLQWGNQEYS